MRTLRENLVKLATDQPKLRIFLIPLLQKHAAETPPSGFARTLANDEIAILKALKMADNEGDIRETFEHIPLPYNRQGVKKEGARLKVIRVRHWAPLKVRGKVRPDLYWWIATVLVSGRRFPKPVTVDLDGYYNTARKQILFRSPTGALPGE